MTTQPKRKPDLANLRLAALGALVVASACAAPMLATETAASAGTEAAPGIQCGIATDSRGSMTTFRPWVRLDPARSGHYSFALNGGGTVIDQGGSFATGTDGQALLGEATVTGRASSYHAELTVTVGGTRYRCHTDQTDI